MDRVFVLNILITKEPAICYRDVWMCIFLSLLQSTETDPTPHVRYYPKTKGVLWRMTGSDAWYCISIWNHFSSHTKNVNIMKMSPQKNQGETLFLLSCCLYLCLVQVWQTMMFCFRFVFFVNTILNIVQIFSIWAALEPVPCVCVCVCVFAFAFLKFIVFITHSRRGRGRSDELPLFWICICKKSLDAFSLKMSTVGLKYLQ